MGLRTKSSEDHGVPLSRSLLGELLIELREPGVRVQGAEVSGLFAVEFYGCRFRGLELRVSSSGFRGLLNSKHFFHSQDSA